MSYRTIKVFMRSGLELSFRTQAASESVLSDLFSGGVGVTVFNGEDETGRITPIHILRSEVVCALSIEESHVSIAKPKIIQ